MDLLWKLLLSNAAIAGCLFVMVLLVRRWAQNPAVLHLLLLLVLIKLITPAVWYPQVDVLTAKMESPAAQSEPAFSQGIESESNSHRRSSAESGLTVLNSLKEGLNNRETAAPKTTKTDLTSSSTTGSAPPGEVTTQPAWSERLISYFAGQKWSFASFAFLIWGVGTVVCFLTGTVRILRFQKLLKHVQPASAELQQRACKLGERIGLKSIPQVELIPGAISPLLWAFCSRARIILPESLLRELNEDEIETLLLHELAHYRRGDHWVRMLELVTTGLYWWYPIVWWVRREIRLAEEACCDAWVIQTEPDKRRAYAEVLVKATGFVSHAQRIPAATGMGSQRILEQRLTSIMRDSLKHQISRRGKFLLALVALMLLSLAPLPGTSQAEIRVAEKPDQLPSVETILDGYRKNIQRLLPLEMTYQVLIKENMNCIDNDRQQLKEAELIPTLKHTDLKTLDRKVVYNEQQFAYVVGESLRRAEELRANLTPDRIKSRQEGWISDRSYFWSDGKSFQRRSPGNPKDSELDLTPRKLTQAALPHYFKSIHVLSAIKGATPPYRVWFGASSSFPQGQGRITDDFNRVTSYKTRAPLAVSRFQWDEKQDWQHLDYFMTRSAEEYTVVGWRNFQGRRTIVLDGCFTPIHKQTGLRNRYRIWVDPERGYLPLRMEVTDVNAQDQVVREVHRYLVIEEIDRFGDSFYPVKIQFQNYTFDSPGIQKQNEKIRAENLDPQSLVPVPLVPGRSEIWTVTSFTANKPMQQDELAWEFPQGAVYTNDLDGKKYVAGRPEQGPLPASPPPPLQPGTPAPPLEVKTWLTGKSQTLEALRGKVVFLLFIDGIQETDYSQIPADMEKPLAQMRKFMKAFHAKYSEKGVVFLEVHPPGTNPDKIRAFHRFRQFETPAAIDLASQQGGKTNILYNGVDMDLKFLLIGRDGRIAFTQETLEDIRGELYYRYVANKLSIPLDGDKSISEEEAMKNGMRILEYMVSEQLDQVLAVEKQ
ncbi:M56 family metallopeptidase [Gimesia panareensis]|uniref:M56 family metallopeptidase n=1 Tax=Gimesia panareensis TaxID=2527978 RepID=UPI00118C80F1|nr:M56 family metallopeptidase [Gimesia panareensis]QDU51276.1 Regulatory protein BlaR1 [Gimesia panareensis]